jgi:hypothetical protein
MLSCQKVCSFNDISRVGELGDYCSYTEGPRAEEPGCVSDADLSFPAGL